MMRFGLVSLIGLAACIPEHDYEGDYEMTYALVVAYGGHRDAHAGTELVRVHHGIDEEYLVDLGPSFCRLTATYVAAELYSDWPYLAIPPQDCWHQSQPISIGGSATFQEPHDRFAIVLSGTITDPDTRGSATLEFTESW
jgi:hypothetical protein